MDKKQSRYVQFTGRHAGVVSRCEQNGRCCAYNMGGYARFLSRYGQKASS